MAKAAKNDLIDLRRIAPKHVRKAGKARPRSNAGRAYCEALTQDGRECPLFAQAVRLRGKRYQLKTCVMHASPAIKKELGVDQPGPGRKQKVSAIEVLQRRVEEDIKRYLKPYEEALRAKRAVVVGNGASAHIQMVEDTNIRLKAAGEILDRVFGKPKQVTELQGGDSPVEITVPQDTQRQRDVAAILAESGALGTVIPANPSAVSPTTN